MQKACTKPKQKQFAVYVRPERMAAARRGGLRNFSAVCSEAVEKYVLRDPQRSCGKPTPREDIGGEILPHEFPNRHRTTPHEDIGG